MIVELAGLPGAGKTTICRAVKSRTGGKNSIALWQLKPTPKWWKAAISILQLAITAKPVTSDRLRRAINLALFLRHYQFRSRVILLDQGLVQKLWSVLADSVSFDQEQLQAVMVALLPFAPDSLCWVETPVEEAVARMDKRSGGNSRYEQLASDEKWRQLEARQALLAQIFASFVKLSGCRVEMLSGHASPAKNAEKIDSLLRGTKTGRPQESGAG